MKHFTQRATIYLILAIMGLIFSIYSLKIKNYILLIIAILFTAVSADNIFCNLRKENGRPT
ncbi:MAG: hypothetical protein Q8R04_05195 [Nanoarchaeota archaeon]|nr:hypothetical protein [Nanoarchaeota archaeon]